MKIEEIILFNFASFSGKHTIRFDNDFLIAFGKNNSGKSNIFKALRFFFQKEMSGLSDCLNWETEDKLKESRKFLSRNSWVQINFAFETIEEESNFKRKDWLCGNVLKITKFFEKNDINCGIEDFFIVKEEDNSDNFYFGGEDIRFISKNPKRNIKLGEFIFIPEFEVDFLSSYLKKENLKKTDSASEKNEKIFNLPKEIDWKEKIFRELIFQISETIKEKIKFEKEIKNFNYKSSEEKLNFIKNNNDDYSLKNLTKSVNEQLKKWDIEVEFFQNKQLEVNICTKFPSSYPSFYIKQKKTNKEYKPQSLSSLGWGIVRFLLYLLKKELIKETEIKNRLKISLKESREREDFKKRDLYKEIEIIDLKSRILLIEEPELFLHPQKQKEFSEILYNLTRQDNEETQVFLTTHSPVFLSKNFNRLDSFLKVEMDKNKKTNLVQWKEESNKNGKG